jgi:hypothetical protein
MPEFVKRAKEDAFRVLTINVNVKDFPPPAQQLRDAAALRRGVSGPRRIRRDIRCAAASARLAREHGAASRHGIGPGAVAVKVWNDIGMQQRDADGRVVMIDDPRFDPVFAWLEQRHAAVLGHQGEPRNAWLPLDQMTIRGDREYFTEHPQYHMAQHPNGLTANGGGRRARSHARQHPGLTFVGVHLASLEWDVDRIAAFLRRYPNASVDLAARLPHLELQASRDRDKVREFFIEFQDRILYGSDFGRGRDQTDAEFAAEAHEGWLADWRFLSGNAELHSEEFDAAFRGLELPRPVLEKVYRENAAAFSNGVARAAGGKRRWSARRCCCSLPPPRVQGDGIRLSSTGRCEAA